MKKLIVAVLVIGACVWFVKKSALFSYASTVWSQVRAETKNAVPTRFEIERVRNEIANLDGDVGTMIRPIAEYKAAVVRLHKDIAKSEQALEEQKGILLSMTKDLEGNPTVLVYAGEEYSADRVRHKLNKDFKSYQRLEGKVKSLRKLLEAKETSLKATQEQLAKVISKKREYELRLAQLEADEETLQIARIGSSLQIDTSRATQIEAALADIEDRQNVQRAEAEYKSGLLANDVIPVKERGQPVTDVQSIRNYLEGSSTEAVKTATPKTATTARP
jgi:chromosome segregation ATPase